MVSAFDSILLGGIQGITEFLPISSSGHLIIARELFNITQTGGLAFDAVLQLATACAVLLFFRKDIIDLLLNLFKKNKDIQKIKLTVYLAIGTIPALIFGFILKDYMETVFRTTQVVALTLIIGSIIMWCADYFLQRRTKTKELNFKNSLSIGLFQCLALVPGMSRSGMTISGGYFFGIQKEQAIRFSFLLSIPIIVGSGLIKLIEIIKEPSIIEGGFGTLMLGAISAFVFGWVSIDFLLKFLKTNTFKGFIVYRILVALILVFFFK